MTQRAGVSFVVPVLNGARHLRAVVQGILAQRDGRPFEIVAVDDGSRDGSRRILRELSARHGILVLHGSRRGAAAAINMGVREARHPIVCQVDQDVILQPGWLTTLAGALEDPEVAAAQGHYRVASGAGFWARAMGRDLEQRYRAIDGRDVDHVCTGNTAYRASALHAVGLLDERLGYGYDNDLSYRLAAAGHRLVFCREANSIHLWREGARGYLRQQFGVGYGRLDVVARHPLRVRGDTVSRTFMMLHAPLMLLALTAGAWSAAGLVAGAPSGIAAIVASLLVLLLAAERALAGIRAYGVTRDPVTLAFPLCHLARDVAWAAAIAAWCVHRLPGVRRGPARSMCRAVGSRERAGVPAMSPRELESGALLAVVPAFNEADNLPRVLAELRRVAPEADVLVVNDGSTDGTAQLLPLLGVEWLSMPDRVGVGGAIRAGIRYAVQHGYDYVVRVDGDGQHRAGDIGQLLAAVVRGGADAASGSRFLRRRTTGWGVRRISQAALARCLSLITGRRVTDPTSGFWMFGPRALRLLARQHPTGYAEPELVLLLSRHELRVTEVPIRMRARMSGATSLTAARTALALARTLLAIVVVPLRRVEGARRD